MKINIELFRYRDEIEEYHKLRLLANSLDYQRAVFLLTQLSARFGVQSDADLLKQYNELRAASYTVDYDDPLECP